MFGFKKAVAMILSLALLLPMMPTNVFAADGVSELEISVDIDLRDVKVSDYSNYLTLNSSSVKILTDYDCPGVSAYCVTDDVENVDTFEAGKNYIIYIYLVAEDYYVLPSSSGTQSVTCYINEATKAFKPIEYSIGGVVFDYLCVQYDFTVPEKSKVKEVDISLSSALDGMQVSDYETYMTFDTVGVRFDETYASNAVRAVEKESQTIAETFELGKSYELWIYLQADKDYVLPEAGEKFYCDINGTNVIGQVYDEIMGEGIVRYVAITYELSVYSDISSVDLSVRKDIAGYSETQYEEFVSINTNGMTFDDDYVEVVLPLYVKEKETDSYAESFESGKTYIVELYLVATDGYRLPDVGEIVPCNVNGATVEGVVEETIYGGDIYSYLCVPFEITVTEPLVSVEFVSLNYSGYEFGADISELSVTTDSEGVEIYYVFVCDENQNIITSGNFEYGKTYCILAYLNPKEGYTLKNLSAEKITFNEENSDIYQYDELYIAALKTLPVLEHTHIHGDFLFDENKHWLECIDPHCNDKLGSIKDKDVHSGGVATCTAQAKCADCGVSYGELAPHNVATRVIYATADYDGSVKENCAVCNKVISERIIDKVSNIGLSKTEYIYNGKEQKPSVKLYDSKNKQLVEGVDFTVNYSDGRVNVGSYKVIITLKGDYAGTITKAYKINPKSTKLSKVKGAKKKIIVKWKKQTKQTTGYQIQYATKSSFKGAKTINVSKNKTTSKTISKLKAKKKYYVRIRTYKTVGGTKYYSAWSSKKRVKTK